MKILFAVLNLVFLSFVAYRVWRTSKESIIIQLYWPSLILKAAAGIGLGLLYLYYYKIPGDTFLFFEDARKLTELARADFLSYIRFLFIDDESSSPLEGNCVFPIPRSVYGQAYELVRHY